MTKRDKVFWLIWLAFVVALLWVCLHQAAKAESWRKRKLSSFEQTTAGSGAALLMSKSIVDPITPSFPKSIILPPRQITNTLAWDYYDLSIVTNFRLYLGTSSGVYSSSNLTGKVLTTRFVYNSRSTNWLVLTALGTNGIESIMSNEIRIPRLFTNLVISVTTVNCTNLQWSDSIGKTWTLYGATNYTATNPAPRMWRGVGFSKDTPPRVKISSVWQ